MNAIRSLFGRENLCSQFCNHYLSRGINLWLYTIDYKLINSNAMPFQVKKSTLSQEVLKRRSRSLGENENEDMAELDPNWGTPRRSTGGRR